MSCDKHFGHSRLPDDEPCPFCERDTLREALKPWGSGGIITGTVLAWIAAKDPAIAKAIVNGKAAVDRALYPLAVEAVETANELRHPKG